MDANSLYTFVFWAAIVCSVLGGVLGLVGIWFEDFFKNETAWKLVVTDLILAGTSIVVAVIIKWLWRG